MALTMPAKTWEKGGSGNASTVSSSANSFTITKDNPLYEASLRLEKKKAEAAAKQLEEDKRKKYEEDKVKAKYYADNIQPFVKTLNDVVNQTGGFFDKWRNQNESNYTQDLYTSLNGHYTKLRDSVTDNSYLKDVLSEDEYIRLERDVNAIGKSIEDTMAGVKSASDVYAQYGSADDYDRHLRLSGMSADELQKQIDDLDKKSDYMSKLDSSYDTIKVMGDDVLKPTKEYDDFRKQYEQDRVELTSYLNNAKYREEANKYGVDPKSMSYEEITSLLNDGTLPDDKRYFVQRYYDSKSNADWQMKRSEEFVNGLDTVDRDWLKKAADAVDVVVSTSTDSHATSEAGHTLKRAYEVLGNKNGWSEEEIRDNIDLAKLYLDAEERENSKKAISEKFAKSSVLSPIVSNAASVLANIPGSLMSLGDSVYQSIYNKYTGNNLPINTNTNSSDLLNLTNDIREATREEIEKKTTAKLPNGKNLGVFAYDALMNIADVATTSAIGGLSAEGKGLSAKDLSKAIARVSGTITSSSAAANKVQESIESGDSNGTAIAKGAIVGAIEAITERLQIDNLVSGIVKGDTAIKTVLKGALSEGSEEVVSNILAEDIMEAAFGNGVRISRAYNDYIEQGYTKERAIENAILDVVGEDAETFLSAAVAGAAFGGINAVTTRANDKANTKMAQDAVTNEISGRGDISFLRGINSIMAAAEESPNDVGVAQAAQKVNDRITHLEDVKKKLSENGSLKRVIGENGVQAEIAKVDAVENGLKETLGLIRDGSYDATIQDYLITQKETAYNADAQATALGDSKLRAAAQKYVTSVGSVKKAVESLIKTKSDIETETSALKQEKKNIQESIRNGSSDANAKKRLGEINTAIRKNTRDADRAEKLTSVLTGNQDKFLSNVLGANQKQISKALSDASGRDVSVMYDSTMDENEMAAMRTNKSGVSTLALNPERILRAQAELDSIDASDVNVAKGKVVHEAGHLAARTDGTFVPKVYEVYASLRDNGLIPGYAVNESEIKAGYRSSLNSFMKTKSVQEEKNDLVANKGMSEEEATRLLEERYMQEEYVMHFLEYMENNAGNLYNKIVPEKRNVFVQAMQKIAQFFRDIAAKIRGKDPASAKKMDSLADKLYNAVRDFAGDSVEARESVNAETAENTADTENAASEGLTGTHGEDERKSLVIGDEGADAEDGDTRYSIKSMRHDIADGKMFDDLVSVGVFSRDEADTLRDNLDNLVKYMIPFAGTVDMNEEYGQGDRPFRAYKPNSDPLYVISLDFSTLCRKRLMTQYVIEQLQLRENRPMTAEEQIAIRSMLLDYRKQNKALQVACAMCYVEAARLKAPKQMEKFFTDTESILKTYFAKKDSEFNAKVRRAQEEFKVSRGYEADTPKSGMKGKDKTAFDRMSSEMRRGYEPSEEQAAIIETAKSLPRSTFLTAANLTELSVNHPEVYDAYTSHIRASTRSKGLEGDIPYYYGDSEGVVSDSFIENVNAENGFRFDSWSDFQMKHMLDMITAVIELSVRKSKMHGYTKFPEMVRIFGKTGMMFNLSGVASGNGFDADGNLVFSDVEGMAYEDAVKLRKDFPETAGFQCIGVSDEHVRALLRSDDIDYVIPYHTSGMNATLRRMVDIYGWKDYTGVQNAKKDPNAKKPANAENWQVEPVWSEFFISDGKDGYDCMQKTAQRYIDMCHERGLIPKFNDFTDEPNYWKLLIDRKMVNQKTGALIEQKPVRPDFDFGLIEDEVKREVSEYDPKLEQDALNYVVDNFDAIGSRIRELKKIAPKKKLQTVGNEVLQAYAEGSKVVDDERKSLDVDGAAKEDAADVRYSVDYQNAKTNNDILDMILDVKRGQYKDNDPVELGVVPDSIAAQIEKLVGVDVRGFDIVIEARQIRHILKDHGENGLTDKSMKNDDDIAKMEYALLSPDDLSYGGTTKAYTKHVNGRDRMADTVLYEKNIGENSYYVVQAVADNSKKRLYIVSAFIGKPGYKNKKGTLTQPANAKSPGVTSKNATVGVPANSVPQPAQNVNTSDEDSRSSLVLDSEYMSAVGANDRRSAQRLVDEKAVEWGAYVDEKGKPIRLYRGTSKWGGYTFSEKGIFTTPDPRIAAGYGHQWYAEPRELHQQYTPDDGTTETLLKNAKTVLEQNYHKMTENEQREILRSIGEESSALDQRINEAWTNEAIDVLESIDSQDKFTVEDESMWVENSLRNALDHILSLPGFVSSVSDDVFVYDGDMPGENVIADIRYEYGVADKYMRPLKDWLGEHRNEIVGTDAENLYKTLSSYDVSDYIIDVGYKLVPAFTEGNLVNDGTGGIVSPDSIRDQVELRKNIGSYVLYGKMGDKPLIIDGKGRPFTNVPVEIWEDETGLGYSTDYISKRANEEGYTSVCIKNIFDTAMNNYSVNVTGDVCIFFDSKNVRSADPITYDDNGNVIPLSQRFNEENDDIRYSKESYESRIARLKEDKEFLNRYIAREISNKKFTAKEKEAWGKELIRAYNLDAATAHEKLGAMLNLIEQSASASEEKRRDLFAQIRRLSRDLIEESGGVDAALVVQENDEEGIRLIEEQAENLEISAMLNYFVPDKESKVVSAYAARLGSIRNNVERRLGWYSNLLARQADKITDLEDEAGIARYRDTVRKRTKAMLSMANNPNRKRFVAEKHRNAVRKIAKFLDDVADATLQASGVSTEEVFSEESINNVKAHIASLEEILGEDGVGIAKLLIDQMVITNESGKENEISQKLALGRLMKTEKNLAWMLYKSIRESNKVYISGKSMAADSVGYEIKKTLERRKGKQSEFESLADKKRSGTWKKVLNEVYNRNLSFTDGYSFFHRMGKVGDSMFETLQDAQSRQVLYMKSYTDTVNEKLKDVDLSKYAGAKQKVVNVTLSNGTEYSMTAAQAMSVVTLYERESGKSHIEKGGIQIYDPKTRQLSKATALTAADIASIRDALDEEDKRVMKVFADFMRDECTAWGNEATMEKYGFHRFTTSNYFPIQVNRDATGADMKTFAPAQFNVENVGFAKSAKDDASAPVVIGSMIDVANAHVNGMATYAAYLNVEDSINRVLKVDGVKDAMRRALGSDAEKYITEMMNDLKGAGKDTKLSDNTVEFLNRMAGRYKAAAVSYNASTVAKQPLSYLRAATVIDKKYLGTGVTGNKKQAHEQMMKYSGIAVRKEIGYSDVGVGKTVGEQIGYTEKGTYAYASGQFNEFGMKGAAAADRLTWEALWIACRAEQAEKNASAALDDDALMKATAKRFAEVVARTQVVDSALTSAPVSRSNNPLVRIYYAFTSEPIKNYNMLVTAIDDLVNSDDKAAKSKAAEHISRVIVYTVIGWAAEAVITSAFQALRDDDDDFFGKFGETYVANLLENSLGVFVALDPVLETIKTKWQGYDVTSMADQPLADLVDNLIDLWDVVVKKKDGKRETEAKIIRDTVESISTLAGIPMKNLARIFTTARKALFHSLDLYKAEYNFQKFWYNPDNATAREKNEFNSLLADAYISGNTEAYEYIYEDMRKSGLKPQSLVSSIAKDAYAGDIADSEKSTLVKYTPGSDAWYIGMKTIFDREENAPKATEDEITRVYKATGETSVLPKFKDGKYTVDGVSREFQGASLDKYLEDYGRLYYEVANAMRELAAYRKGSADEQVWWLTKAERFASAVAVYTQDKDYSVTSVGKWVTDYINKKPYEVAKYIVGNLEKK